jgi:hypothetical protein
MSIQFNVGQVSLTGNTAGQILPARVGRKEVRLIGVGNTPSSSPFAIGPDNSVTLTSGYKPPLLNGEYIFNTEGEIWGIGQQTHPLIGFLEIY